MCLTISPKRQQLDLTQSPRTRSASGSLQPEPTQEVLYSLYSSLSLRGFFPLSSDSSTRVLSAEVVAKPVRLRCSLEVDAVEMELELW